jgi:hypothetical protein
MASKKKSTDTASDRLMTAMFGGYDLNDVLREVREEGKPPSHEPLLGLRISTAGSPTVGELAEFLKDLRQAYKGLLSVEQGSFTSAPARATRRVIGADLIVRRINLASPGLWEFLGALNPLKVIADYVQQRHERLKDNEYRNRLEEEQLILKNELLRNQVIRERLEILSEAADVDPKAREYVIGSVVTPLRQLGRHAESGFVTKAEVADIRDPAV